MLGPGIRVVVERRFLQIHFPLGAKVFCSGKKLQEFSRGLWGDGFPGSLKRGLWEDGL